jgi:hypothetical protein
MLAMLLAVGPRWPFRSWWLAGGIAAAAAIAAPYVAWQAVHGFPQLTVAHHTAGSAEGGRAGFVPFQLVLVSPVLVPVWIAGLLAPFRRSELRSLRFASLTYPVLGLLYIAGDGKAYYLASLYPLLLGIGALPAADWAMRSRRRGGLLVAAVVLSAAVSALIALPLLPERSLQGSAVMGLNPDQGETVGWPRFVHTIEQARDGLPAQVRAKTAIFTANYGEAGAIDVLGSHALPRAYSAHNGFSEWGQPPPADTHALVIGYDGPRDAAPEFVGCRILARIDDGVGLDNDEQGLPIQLCRPSRPWSTLWPKLRHFD